MEKIFKTFPLFLLLCCSIFTGIQSCFTADETDDNVTLNNLEEVNLFKSMKAIQNELTNNNELIDKIRNNAALKSSGNDQQFIDQESLDYLLDVAGVSNLEISLEEVNSLIGESLAAQDLGYDIYIQNNIAMSSQAKFYLEDIVNNETFIVGLEQQQSFLNLSNEEQNILVGVNNYAKNYITKSKDPFFNDGFWVGSSVGSALGLSIPFCPPCGLVGWIVGGIVGSLTK